MRSQILAALLSASLCASQELNKAITPALSTFAEQLLDEFDVPGMSVGVVHVNKISGSVDLEFGAWGNRTEEGDAVEKETLFYIGSCSKAFLAAALGILMDDFASGRNATALPARVKKFTWQTKILDLFPEEWKIVDDFANERANVGDILSHVTGLPPHDLSYSPTESASDVVRRLRYLKPSYELREQYQYNNQMFILGSHIVETYAKTPHTTFVKERIFVPLNMSSSTYFTTEVSTNDHISEAFTQGRRRIPYWFGDLDAATLIAGAGGIISNTVDMTKWLAMLLNNGINPYTNETVVSPSALEIITSARVISRGSGPTPDISLTGYGLGWVRFSYKGHELVQHNGGLPGFVSSAAFLPWDGIGVIAFVNNGRAESVPWSITSKLVENAVGLEPQAAVPSAERISVPSTLSLSSSTNSSTPPPLPLESYAGTYSDRGYGNFTLCSPTSTSNYCTDVLKTFSSILPDDATPGLYATWSRFWTKHVQMTPTSGNQFNFETFTIFPEGYGRNTTPLTDSLYPDMAFPVVFDVEDGVVRGLAFFEDIAEGVNIPGGKLDLNDAVVYFERV